MKRRSVSSARRMCALPLCAGLLTRADTPFCARHWRDVPEDLRERIQWANVGESLDDYRAAVRAAAEHIRPAP